MNTNSSQRALTSATRTTRQPSSESTPTATASRWTNSATQRALLTQILQKASEITESIDRMLLYVTPPNQRASMRYTVTDSILTEQEREEIRLEAESSSSIRGRYLSRRGV